MFKLFTRRKTRKYLFEIRKKETKINKLDKSIIEEERSEKWKIINLTVPLFICFNYIFNIILLRRRNTIQYEKNNLTINYIIFFSCSHENLTDKRNFSIKNIETIDYIEIKNKTPKEVILKKENEVWKLKMDLLLKKKQ